MNKQAIWAQYRQRRADELKANQATIKACLTKAEDGLTLSELSKHTRIPFRSVKVAVEVSKGLYIDRWLESTKGRQDAVYMLGDFEACPKPAFSVRQTQHWPAPKL